MRKLFCLVIVVFLLLVSNTYAKQEKKGKDKKYKNFQLTCIFGNEDYSKMSNLEKEQLLEQYLRKKQVLFPEYYAWLLVNRVKNWEEQKLLAAMLTIESHGRTDRISPEGAIGPWQVMPFWKHELEISGDLKDPETNLACARMILSIYHQESNGDLYGDLRGYKKSALYKYSCGAGKYKNIKNKIQKIEEG